MAEEIVPLDIQPQDIVEVEQLYNDAIEGIIFLVQKLRDIHPDINCYKFTSGTIDITIVDKDPHTQETLKLAR
jgi:hypothetical protein